MLKGWRMCSDEEGYSSLQVLFKTSHASACSFSHKDSWSAVFLQAQSNTAQDTRNAVLSGLGWDVTLRALFKCAAGAIHANSLAAGLSSAVLLFSNEVVPSFIRALRTDTNPGDHKFGKVKV